MMFLLPRSSFCIIPLNDFSHKHFLKIIKIQRHSFLLNSLSFEQGYLFTQNLVFYTISEEVFFNHYL